jgi:hypothetical protein
MNEELTPREALLKAIAVFGGKQQLSDSSGVARTSIYDALARDRRDDEDLMTPETARKIGNAAGIPWKLLAPESYRKLFG